MTNLLPASACGTASAVDSRFNFVPGGRRAKSPDLTYTSSTNSQAPPARAVETIALDETGTEVAAFDESHPTRTTTASTPAILTGAQNARYRALPPGRRRFRGKPL